MKTALLLATIVGAFALAVPAHAGGRVGVYFGGGGYYGGCGPRYYAPRVCYAARPVYYCAPRVVYYRPAPVCYAPVYRAPVLNVGVSIGPAFGWRRW